MKKVEDLTDEALLLRLGICPECGSELTGGMCGGECEQCGFTHGPLEVVE